MTKAVLCTCSLLMMIFMNHSLSGASQFIQSLNTNRDCLTAMEALDLVKEQYADNFKKMYAEADTVKAPETDETGAKEVYFYKLPFKDYYLVYEGIGDTEDTFIIHLYEFVLDEPDLNLGHTVTYGWYTVDKWTGKITEITD